MKKYEILEHPAELRLRVYGKTLEELFENAALAMGETQKKNDTFLTLSRKKCVKEKIEVQSLDINTLLVDFLNEILAKSQINKCVYYVSDIKIDASRFTLHVSCTGYPVERFEEDIKAVTYEDLDIKKINDIYQTDLVFDI